jgi:hypothetical protein
MRMAPFDSMCMKECFTNTLKMRNTIHARIHTKKFLESMGGKKLYVLLSIDDR